MIFSSLTFVVFFAVVLWLLRTLRSELHKRLMLLAASYVFYGWWDWRFCSLILASSLWSWWLGIKIADATDPTRKKRLLAASLCMDLGLLMVFKYANFFMDSFYSAFGLEPSIALNITLPVGISFFTFQTMSYSIDLYRGRIEVCRDMSKFMLFVSFFPQLVAGPIVRASEFLPQLNEPIRVTRRDISIGLQIFLLGLFQKILVADNLSSFIDPVFKDPALWDAATLWAGLGAYTLQIFCDFSGYSLMAIGVARVMGFTLPENFRTPYLSRSITEFWRRWHISLSSWLRDYLYISLGGNKRGKWRTDFNLMATMLLGGLWHGAGWNFIIWGFFHGLGLMAHKHWSRRIKMAERIGGGVPGAVYSVAMWGATLLFVALLWVPFRAQDLPTTVAYFSGMFDLSVRVHWLHTTSLVLIALMAAWHTTHIRPGKLARLLPSDRPTDMLPMWTILIMLFAVLMFAPLSASPFIYFQF